MKEITHFSCYRILHFLVSLGLFFGVLSVLVLVSNHWLDVFDILNEIVASLLAMTVLLFLLALWMTKRPFNWFVHCIKLRNKLRQYGTTQVLNGVLNSQAAIDRYNRAVSCSVIARNKTGFTVYIKLSGNASIDKFFDNETFESVKSWLENNHFHFVEKKLIQRSITLVVLSFERTQ